MVKSIDERASSSFSDDDWSYVEKFLEAIRVSLKEVSDSLRRTTVLVLTLCAVFELLTRSRKVTFSGIELTDTAVIQKALPIVIAYLFYEQRILSLKWSDLVTLSQNLTRRFRPLVRENDLDTLLYPRLLALWDITKLTEENYYPVEKFDFRVAGVLTSVVLALPIIFEIYAYFRLFSRFGSTDILLWLSLLLSGALVAALVINIVLTFMED